MIRRFQRWVTVLALLIEGGPCGTCDKVGQFKGDGSHAYVNDPSDPKQQKCSRIVWPVTNAGPQGDIFGPPANNGPFQIGEIKAGRSTFFGKTELADEWSFSAECLIYSNPLNGADNPVFYVNRFHTGEFHIEEPIFSVFYQHSSGKVSFLCHTCEDTSVLNLFDVPTQYFDGSLYASWNKIEIKQVRRHFSYNVSYSQWSSNSQLDIKVYLNDNLQKTLKQNANIGYPPDGSYKPTFYFHAGPIHEVPTDQGNALKNVRVIATSSHECDECYYGHLECVENAFCSDRNIVFHQNDYECFCKSGFFGLGNRQCRSCNDSYNCVSKRSGCGGEYPVELTQFYLEECLSSHSNDIKINNQVHRRQDIIGIRSQTKLSFYKGPTEFIYFDQHYQQWRIGGSNAPTREANCETLDICNLS